MSKINLKAGDNYVEPTLNSGDKYLLEFKALYSSLQDGREGFKDKQTGEMNEWISINAQVASEGVPHVYAGSFFVIQSGDKTDEKSMRQIKDLYKAATGNEAPDEIDVDELFIDLEGKHFVSKVFLKTDKDGNEILNDRGDRQYSFSPWTEAFDPEADKPAAPTEEPVETPENGTVAPFSDMF